MALLLPFGALVQWGAVTFPGRSTPLSAFGLETQSDVAPATSTAYGFDVRAGFPAPYKDPKVTTTYLLKAASGLTGLSATSDVEAKATALLRAIQGTYTYGGAQISGQVGQLILRRANGTDLVGAWARVSKIEISLQPGQNTMHYLVPITWTLQSGWAAVASLPSITATPSSLVGVVPFGRIVSHAGTVLGSDGPPVTTLVYEWAEQYKAHPTRPYPRDMRGVGPVPIKEIAAVWSSTFHADPASTTDRAAYTSVEAQVTTAIQGLTASPVGSLVVRRADDATTVSARARWVKADLALTPGKDTWAVRLPLTFLLLSDFA
jgi:hypothetical protein